MDAQSDGFESSLLYRDNIGFDYANMLLRQFLLTLGEYSTGTYYISSSGMAWLCFILAAFMSQVVIFNMLIAVVSDTYTKVTEIQGQTTLKEKVTSLTKYIEFVGEFDPKSRYLVIFQAKVQHDLDLWQGTVTEIKQSIKGAVE